MQNNCSLQTVPSVNVKKTTPTLGTNYCPRWQPRRGGQGLTVISPFSACSGPAVRVCMSGLWLNGVCSVLCRAASLASFISTDFYH